MTPSTQTRHIYHVSPMRYYLPWFLFAPIMLPLTALLFDPKNRMAGVLVLLILACIPLGIQWLIRRARLEVTESGIRLRQVGYTLETEWSNISQLRMDRGREGFVTREPILGKGASHLASYSGVTMYGTPIYDPQQRALLQQQRFIPIEAFAWHLKHGTLGAEMERYAPHLHYAMSAQIAPTSKERRQRVQLAVFITLLVVGSFAFACLSPSRMSEALRIGECLLLPLITLRTAYSAWVSFRKHNGMLGCLFSVMALFLALMSIGCLSKGS